MKSIDTSTSHVYGFYHHITARHYVKLLFWEWVTMYNNEYLIYIENDL